MIDPNFNNDNDSRALYFHKKFYQLIKTPRHNKISSNAKNPSLVINKTKERSLFFKLLKSNYDVELFNFDNFYKKLSNNSKFIPPQEYELEQCNKQIKTWRKQGIETITIGSKFYPKEFYRIDKAPLVIFVRGEKIDLLHQTNGVSIVGARSADIVGCNIAYESARILAEHKITTISGLAIGIDGASHKGAIDYYSKSPPQNSNFVPTIAILGNGVDKIYPARHKKLAKRVLENNGLIMSAYIPGTPPYPNQFLQRNQLIASLGKSVLVVQAAKRSGALSTARTALELGKDVMCTPGNIHDRKHAGCNLFIKNGAFIQTKLDDILEIANNPTKTYQQSCGLDTNSNNVSCPTQIKVLNIIEAYQPISINQILKISNIKQNILSDHLAELELNGLTKQVSANIYTKV